ncbi:hypothetical protein M0R45_021702 [Rubus argutus]|uniref:Uncharacterized protein n=1 Tax=Rubus argutus TaxID=59490 RepID=A0AAW1XDR5_RUBAR
MADNRQPLLSPRDDVLPPSQNHVHNHLESLPAPANLLSFPTAPSTPTPTDIPPINGVRDFFREFKPRIEESSGFLPSCHLHFHMPVLSRRRHSNLCRPCRHSRPRRHLR